jgi:hypothetical protein
VRYYSAERYSWEELPNSLVDWAATDAFNKQPVGKRPAVGIADVSAIDDAERRDREREAARTPKVAPGVNLPSSGGVFLLDQYRGTPELVELIQNGGELNKQMGRNIMRAIINPLPSGSKQSIDLKDQHARVQSHLAQPTLYVDIDTDDSPAAVEEVDGNEPSPVQPSGAAPVQGGGIGSAPQKPPGKQFDSNTTLNMPDRFKIVRLKVNKDRRVVSDVKVSLFGKVSQQENAIPAIAEQVMNGEWVKVVPSQPLEPGEYALVEMLGPKQINFYVWDFGIDPGAPENATAWKPAPVKQKPAGTDESPMLGKRPKK